MNSEEHEEGYDCGHSTAWAKPHCRIKISKLSAGDSIGPRDKEHCSHLSPDGKDHIRFLLSFPINRDQTSKVENINKKTSQILHEEVMRHL